MSTNNRQPTILQTPEGELLDFIVQVQYYGLPTGSLSDGTYRISPVGTPTSNLLGGDHKNHTTVQSGSYRYHFDDTTWKGVVLKGPRPQHYDNTHVVERADPGGPNPIPEPGSMIVWGCILVCSFLWVGFRWRRVRSVG